MSKKITHTDLEVPNGAQIAREYLEIQKRLGKFYQKGFLSILQNKKTGRLLYIGSGPGYQSVIIAGKISIQKPLPLSDLL